ncbi:50S ribosomal protein L25/general stress protein Ctc [Aquicella lusitana]|uniref:Large ribosomal subunit protein bL25 n=1 Tax=Aquicella lusitana TaxID=254246 RepID=A0A370GYM2_9COXI|nr:50S ribosomal protein L25/general stress protein Ctc [Aquicella lusitana]RDI48599.1 LSU ribosomal protein L25P [Aquicella lusitana]VVC74024.1 50S ribosomal protein L25 [Aquicella lusitana]
MASKNHTFEIEAAVRHDKGKGASRRLRREDKIPGVVYGGGKEAVSLSFEHKKLAKSLENEAFYSHILTLKTGTDSERVILKDLQRHPYKARILHVDLQRVRADEKLHMSVPLHFIGGEKAPGAKDAGGMISHIETDVEIACLPDDLPEYIEVDISGMQLNDILHLSDIKVPKGVEIVALAHEDDKPIVSIHMPREEEVPTEAPEASEVPAIEQEAEDKGEEPEEK